MKNSEYFTKPVAMERNNSKEIAKAKMRVRNYWSILILLLVLLLLFLMLRVVWYAPKLTATLGVKDENPDYIGGEINIFLDPTEWTNGDVLVSIEYNSMIENVKKEVSIDGGNTFVEYIEPIKVAKNTKIVARIVGNDAQDNLQNNNNTVKEDANIDPQIIAEESLDIENIDKLEPKEFSVTAEPKNQTITVNANAEDAEATEESGKSGIREYEYIIRRGDLETRKVLQENTCKFDMLQAGETYTIQVYAIDNAGNKKASEEIEVKLKELSRLTINPNGGTWEGTTNNKDIYQEPGTTKEISEPTRAGYTFKRWVISNGGKIVDNIYTYGNFDEMITAEWEINKYTLTLDANGGAVTQNTITENYDTRITLPIPNIDGYTISYNPNNGQTIDSNSVSDTFAGWYTDKDAGEKREYISMPAGDETLYAHWDNTSARITLPTPTKTGYTFDGWYEDSSLNVKVGNGGEEYKPTKDVTLYAKWKINEYTLNFDANEGTVTPNIITADFNASVTLPSPIREYEISYNTNGGNTLSNEYGAYNFLGWYTDKIDGEKREYINMPAANETLYAHWDNTSARITLPTPTKTGYTFDGWYEDSAFSKKAGDAGENYIPTSNITLCAKWKANEYTLTFDANEGTVTPNTIKQEFNTKLTLPVPTREYSVAFDTMGGESIPTNTYAYKFLGWFTDKTSGEEKKYVTMPLGDETLYAHWDSASASITLPLPTKAGYTFDGWYEDNTYAVKVGNAGDKVPVTEDTTIYAKWNINQYTLTFDAVGGDVTPNTITEDYNTNITLPTPTREYTVSFDTNGGTAISDITSTYNFLGWYTDIVAGDQRTYLNMPAGDETLYAHWDNTSASITLPLPIKAGYVFKGWYEDSACTILVGKAGGNYNPTNDITLYADWKLDKYTLTFDVGNDASVNPQTITQDYGAPITLPTPIKEYTITYETNGGNTLSNEYAAYDFLGWYTNPILGEQRAYTTMPNLDETLYPHWNNLSASITLPMPSKIGHTFEGWYADSSFGTKIGNAGEDYIATKDITLYAKWNINQYTLTFDVGNGAIVAPNTITQNYGTAITLPTPTKTGYTFAGWYKDSALTLKVGDAGDSYTVTDDATIYASWKINPYTITLDPTGGTLTSTTIKEEYGEPINLPTPIQEYTLTYDTVGGNSLSDEYSAYNFLGWFTDPTSGDQRAYTTMPAKDETLYAHWDNTTASISLAEPTKIGYTFDGWYEDSTYTNKIGEALTDIILTKDTIIYAKWKTNQYTLTFDVGNGAFVAPQTVTQDYNTTISLPTPTKTGYTFNGWYEDSSLTTKVGDAGANYTITKDAMIYAAWQINQYTLTFDAVGGIVGAHGYAQDTITADFGASIDLPTPIQEYEITYNTDGGNTLSNEYLNFDFTGWYTKPITGDQRVYTTMPGADETLYAHWDYTSASITLPTPTKIGYTFEGWYEDSGFATKAGNAGDSYATTEDVTLYAKWNINTYTLTLDANGGIAIPNSITEEYNTSITLPTPARGSTVSFDTNGGDSVSDVASDYTFTGWYTDKVSGEQRTYTKMPAGDETLYAHWDRTSTKITLPMPTKTGYTFTGWYEDSTFATKAGDAGDYYTPAGDITLYASWQINQYTLTLDATGGTVSLNIITEDYNASINLPNPTREHTVSFNTDGGTVVSSETVTYTFTGWYTDKVSGDQKTYTKMPALDETLYAHWDGTNVDITLPTPTKTGYTFVGWYEDNTYAVKVGNAGDVYTVTKDITLCAKWDANEYTLSFDANGGTVTPTSITSDFDTSISMPNATMNGYTITFNTNGGNTISNATVVNTFAGWFTAPVDGEERTYTKMPAGDATLYAHWNAGSYTLPTPTKSGATFDAWYEDSEGTILAGKAGETYIPKGNVTLYAKWIAIYAKLYDDGALVFTATDRTIEGKTVYENFGNIVGKIGFRGFLGYDNDCVTSVDFADKIYPISTQYWFLNCSNLTTINNIQNLDTSKVTDMNSMFRNCSGLTSLNLRPLDTSKVTDMGHMFYGCSSLTNLDLSSFDTRNVTNMRNMFSYCSGLTSLDLSSFNTGKVTNMSYMFIACSNLTKISVTSANWIQASECDKTNMLKDCGTRSVTYV